MVTNVGTDLGEFCTNQRGGLAGRKIGQATEWATNPDKNQIALLTVEVHGTARCDE